MGGSTGEGKSAGRARPHFRLELSLNSCNVSGFMGRLGASEAPEAGNLRKVVETTVHMMAQVSTMARVSEIPAFKVRGQGRIERAEFDKWIEAEPRGRDGVVRIRWAVDERLRADELTTVHAHPGVRWAGHVQFRPGLRHEMASALAMWRRYRDGAAAYPALAVYLAATHHGKVRTVLRSTNGEGDDVFGVRSEPETLLLGAAQWPLDFSVAKDEAPACPIRPRSRPTEPVLDLGIRSPILTE